jgi:hypothetical protein
MPSFAQTPTSPLLSPTATTTTSTMPPPTMTTEEVGEALASLATSSTPRPLLGIWKSQRPAFRVTPLTVRRDEAVGGPTLLEDDGTRVGRRLPLSSLCPTGTQASAAGQSAGNTPYPNAAILFESGDDEDDDIKCGRCENPIAYCHCSPTMLPHASMSTKKTTKKPKFPPRMFRQRKSAGGGTYQPRNGRRGRRERKSSDASQPDVRTWDPAARGALFPIPHSRRLRPQSRTELRPTPYPHYQRTRRRHSQVDQGSHGSEPRGMGVYVQRGSGLPR